MIADTIVCEYKLPLPASVDGLSDVDWSTVEFLTMAFDDPRDGEYLITDQGQLYKYNIDREWVEDKSLPTGGSYKEKGRSIEAQSHTGEVSFACYFLREATDYLVRFQILFYKGALKGIDLKDWKAIDNSERIKLEELFKLNKDRQNKIEASFWFPFYSLFRKGVFVVFSFIRYTMRVFSAVAWKIERFLTPF